MSRLPPASRSGWSVDESTARASALGRSQAPRTSRVSTASADTGLAGRWSSSRGPSHKPLVEEVVEEPPCVTLSARTERIEHDLRVRRRLVGVIDPRPASNFAASGAGVHAFGVASLTFLERRIHEDLDEPVGADHLAH